MKGHSHRRLYAIYLLLFTTTFTFLFSSCSTKEKKRFVIGVSQCSEDVWREKLNEELRIAALYYNNVKLDIKSANDDVKMQTQQIDAFVNENVDLLIVAPGQVSISPAIDRAYEKGIPVIIFDRRTRSDKYTAYIGADNRKIGSDMGRFLASAGVSDVVELCGLSSSSPAIERADGFESIANGQNKINLVKKLYADWTEKGAYHVVDSMLSATPPHFTCIFAHNDRMAVGARKACQKHGLDISRIRFCGIDAMPEEGGGMQLISEGKLFASYTYPTRGDEVMQLAMNILTGKKYERENLLASALVTHENASVLLMQYDETVRQQSRLATLRSRVDKAASDFQTQRVYLIILVSFLILLIVACALAVNAYRTKALINRKLKEAMKRQEQLTKEIEDMTQRRLQFFTNVSHELRTPLTLIAGPTEQLLEDPTVKAPHRSMLEMIHRNTHLLLQLAGEILDLRKVQTNKAELVLNRFDLQKALTLWSEDFRTIAIRRKLTITVDTSTVKEEPIIIADRDKISHIYFNLMSNALKYTPEGGSITTSLAYANHTYTIKVSDTGKGVAEDELPRLFERFYQARGAEGGTGIGLSLVKAFVELHNGKVHAKSKEGKGLTIVVSLPDSQPGYDPAKDVEKEKPTAEAGLIDDNYVTTSISAKESAERITKAEDFDHDRPLVLIIDDNDGMRSYLHSILKQKYNISEAANGKEGLEKARREVPKLVVCDVMMPVMDGLEFTRQLKADTATCHIPVILLTARSLTEQREEGYGTGADSYLTKPFSGSVLLARIDNLLRSRSMLRSIFSGSTEEKEEEKSLNTLDQTFIGRLREVMQKNMGDSEYSVERLGADVGLSRVQLYRKVKALTGQTPVELLRKARLEKAKKLLLKTERSVAEIAYEVGFTSPSYFNKCFKDEFGMSPGESR